MGRVGTTGLAYTTYRPKSMEGVELRMPRMGCVEVGGQNHTWELLE